MMNHPGEARLNDYLDGCLDARDEIALDEHLAQCTRCSLELEQLRRIVDAAAALGDSIEPARDLWPAIDARIDDAAGADLDAWRPRPRGALWAHRYQLAAAATLLVLTASTGTLLLMRDSGGAPAVIATADPAVAKPGAAAVRLVSVPGQADYAEAIRELDALLRTREQSLDPETAEVVRRNMAIIDRAIREAQTALAADPANGDLNRAVSSAYKTKINLLRRAVELPART